MVAFSLFLLATASIGGSVFAAPSLKGPELLPAKQEVTKPSVPFLVLPTQSLNRHADASLSQLLMNVPGHQSAISFVNLD